MRVMQEAQRLIGFMMSSVRGFPLYHNCGLLEKSTRPAPVTFNPCWKTLKSWADTVERKPCRKFIQETQRTIRTFAVASFLNDMGSDIIYPIWPLFVTQVLKANMAALGFLDGLGEALVSLSQAASGYFSDRIRKRKVFIWIGYLCGAVSRLGYAASSVWQHLIPFRILDRAGKIRSAPRDALIADISTDENRGRHFGLLRTMDNFGAVVGILISIALFNVLGYRLLFALAAIPSVIGAPCSSCGASRNPRPTGSESSRACPSRTSTGTSPSISSSTPSSPWAPSPIRSFCSTPSRRDSRPGFIPVLYLVFSATAALLSSRSAGSRTGSAGSPSCSWPSAPGRPSAPGSSSAAAWPIIALLFVLYGVHKAALDPVQKTLVAELAPRPSGRACLGGFQMVIGLCALPASLLAGFLWDKAGRRSPFFVSLGLTAVAGSASPFVKETRRPPA